MVRLVVHTIVPFVIMMTIMVGVFALNTMKYSGIF
jgi:hypothetical protein